MLEWEDTLVSGTNRGVRVGSWFNPAGIMQSGIQFNPAPTIEDSNLGFRVATVPEPAPCALLALGLPALLGLRRRKGQNPPSAFQSIS